MTTFDFTIIYYKRAKNPINGLFQRFDFKDNSELFTMRRQPFSNFLSKFQEHLKNINNNLIKEQNIDFNKTSLFKNILNLVKTL